MSVRFVVSIKLNEEGPAVAVQELRQAIQQVFLAVRQQKVDGVVTGLTGKKIGYFKLKAK